MHAGKILDQLQKLAHASADIDTFVKALVLIEGLQELNRDVDDGFRKNETVRQKLRSARGWFAILCDVGEDGSWLEDDVRRFIIGDLSVVRDHTGDRRFRAWPEVTKDPEVNRAISQTQIAKAVAEEREACAKVAEAFIGSSNEVDIAEEIAAELRRRSD